jgi:hypothetical protein
MTSIPATIISPPSTIIALHSSRIVVVLTALSGPTKSKISPEEKFGRRFSTAHRDPKYLYKLDISIISKLD